jgi:tetratricopeptide (TPR) repeat protein
MRKYREAINDFTLAINLNPEHFKAIFNRAFCFEKLCFYEESLNDYETCLKLQPTNHNVIFTIANLKSRLGDDFIPQAIDSFLKYIIYHWI